MLQRNQCLEEKKKQISKQKFMKLMSPDMKLTILANMNVHVKLFS